VSEANKALARKIMDIFSSGDPSGIEELVAPNAVDHQGLPGVDTNGPEGFRRMLEVYRTAFQDARADVVAVVAEGDLAVVHFHMTGTNSGAFMGMPATGKPIDVQGVDIMRFENGQAVEHWGYYEEAKMMQQLGLMPAS
jgi:steroid delta-isomerase-like uncharacterized protein